MTERSGRLERLLAGGPFVLLCLFVFYNVGVRTMLAFGVNTPITAGVADWRLEVLVGPNPWGWTVLVLGTLPLLWFGGRTLLGRGSRRTNRWATVWAIGVFVYAFGPFLTLVGWGDEYGYFEDLWLVPTQTEAAVVSGVLVVVGGLASLWDWTPAPTGAATRTEDDGVSTATDETPPVAARRSLLTTVVPAGVVVFTIISNVYLYYILRPWEDSPQTTPAVSFDFESRSDGRVRITHTGGDTLFEENAASVTVRYTDASGTQRIETWGENPGEFAIRAGDTYTTSNPVEPGTRVRVVWTALTDDLTQTVGAFEVGE